MYMFLLEAPFVCTSCAHMYHVSKIAKKQVFRVLFPLLAITATTHDHDNENDHSHQPLKCGVHLSLGAALSWGVFQKVSRILDLRVSFDGE